VGYRPGVVKFKTGGRSRNLEDRRGRSSGGMPGGGMAVGGGAGVVGVIVLLLTVLSGGDPGGFGAFEGASQPVDPADEPLVDEMSAALDDIQDFWHETMPWADGVPAYRDAKLVLFTSGVTTGGCGSATSAVGPFYCPADEKAYLDLSFFKELDRRFGAPGDFAQVYVLAHELGHHVQNISGTNREVRGLQQQNPSEANALSIRMELQADCYAGVWGHSARQRGLLEPGDLQEGLDAAAAIGDDRLSGEASKESWTHGSSEQRVRWFSRGFETGDPASCNTFQADRL
jgi:uncharacterized protein